MTEKYLHFVSTNYKKKVYSNISTSVLTDLNFLFKTIIKSNLQFHYPSVSTNWLKFDTS